MIIHHFRETGGIPDHRAIARNQASSALTDMDGHRRMHGGQWAKLQALIQAAVRYSIEVLCMQSVGGGATRMVGVFESVLLGYSR